ncbi:phosphoribosyltransferase [Halopseudomonas bauzanensis]|uniref:phosphoribosyltransferase n=1 Tax=Halopseudomonas bauzanensis TaxID=653930 RepID=UPI0025546F82|nr:phosphoribosyltransferase family protein [Halopseudomonas bauzanensis]
MIFADRKQAGQALAQSLTDYAGRADALLLALPRGGVPVAAEVAAALHLPLDILLVRKLGVPGHEEYAMGAIAEGGSCYLDHALIHSLGITDEQVEATRRREEAELQRRGQTYRGVIAAPELLGRTAILVDDGLATGATMLAAISAVRDLGAAAVVVAVPVAAAETGHRLEALVDELICPHLIEPLRGVGLWYEDFSQVSDDVVIRLLSQYRTGVDHDRS